MTRGKYQSRDTEIFATRNQTIIIEGLGIDCTRKRTVHIHTPADIHALRNACDYLLESLGE